LQAILLVGGFAASDWLFSRLQKYLQPLGLEFFRPDSHVCVKTMMSRYFPHFPAGIRLFLMARFRFTSITLYQSECPGSPTAQDAIGRSIKPIPNT